MKKNNEKITGQQKKSKRQRIMATVVASVSSVALLTTATYAWFSLNNAAQVNQLTLKAGTTGSLLISKTGQSNDFHENISFEENEIPANACLKPLTTMDGVKFYKPVYGTEGKVVGIEDSYLTGKAYADILNKNEENGGWLIEKEFYLKANVQDNTEDVGIRLLAPKKINNEPGTVIDNVKADEFGAEAIRISLTYDNGTDDTLDDTTVILEPNADIAIPDSDKETQVSMKDWETKVITIKQNKEDKLFANDDDGIYDDYTTKDLFRIPTNTASKVVMRIWIEGADKDCINDIVGSSISTQIRFISEDMN